MEAGRTYVPPKPWARGQEPCWVAAEALLPSDARQLLARFRAGGAAAAAGGGGAGGGPAPAG